MDLTLAAAIVGLAVLVTIIVLQLALALGFPLGAYAWGGAHRVLPPRLRLGSVAAALLLGVAIWVLFARIGAARPRPGATGVRVGTWAFAAYFALNVLGNLRSRSRAERLVMTPLAALLAASFAVVGLA